MENQMNDNMLKARAMARIAQLCLFMTMTGDDLLIDKIALRFLSQVCDQDIEKLCPDDADRELNFALASLQLGPAPTVIC